mgnify:CR=1 FL=1
MDVAWASPVARAAPHTPAVEMHDKDVVQHHVHQAAGDDADDADMGRAVGLDLDLQVVGHGEKDGEAGDDPHVLLYQVVVFPGGPRKSATQSRLNRTSTARSRVAAMTTNRFWLK